MVLDNLGNSLRDVLRKIGMAREINEDLIKEVVRDIQRALLQADVNVKLVLKLTKAVEQRALQEKPPEGVNSREHVIKIIYEELVKILGNPKKIALKPQTIMMVGLYGQGKTTTCGKLAKYFQKHGLNVALIAGDVHRPAAHDQLQQLAKITNAGFYGEKGEIKAAKIVRNGLAKTANYQVKIIDTSGRHSLETELIEEIKRVATVAKPDEIFLVIDATVGQQAGPQAKAFHEAVGITGVIVTKLDGSAKGGGALSAVAETQAPIVCIGVGEHIEDLEEFEPTRFISRLLGMGDLQTLLEKIKESGRAERIEEQAKKMIAGKFTLKDMYEQMESLTNIGPLQKVMSFLPFGGKVDEKQLEETQARLKKFKVIMDSMTDEELENPNIIKGSRILRIARGAGVETRDVRELLKYYEMSKKAAKGIMSDRKMRKQLEKQMKDFQV
ncbi:MAG: signal recognition particle protein Srp54 [Thermoplasmata archaeon]